MGEAGDPSKRHSVVDDPDWDPMRDDFKDPNFNSYITGPGRSLPASMLQSSGNANGIDSEGGGVKLYVTGIPNEMTEVGLNNLFSQCGKVLRTNKLPSKLPDTLDTFGFVTMATVHDAELAIQKLDNFCLKNNKFKMHVRIAVPKSELKQRQEKREQEQESINLISSLYNGEHSKVQPGDVKPVPELGKYNVVQQAVMSAKVNTSPKSRFITPAPSVEDLRSSHCATTKKPSICELCGLKASKKCSICKMPYCSRICQEKAWPTHKLTHAKKPVTSSFVPSDKELTQFERRFDITIGEEMTTNLLNAAGLPATLAKEIVPIINSQNVEPSHSTAHRLKYSDAKKVDLIGKVQVMLSNFTDPSDFWVYLQSSHSQLVQLLSEMSQFYQNTTNNPSAAYSPEVGVVCAAQFTLDKLWYRALINRILMDGSVAVTYIDYGNSEEISVEAIRSLEPQFTTLPLQAVHCSLHKVEPVSLTWSDQAKMQTALLMNESQPHCAMTRYRDNNATYVDVINADGVNVVEALVEKGFARLRTEQCHLQNSRSPPQGGTRVTSTTTNPVTPPNDKKVGSLGIPPPHLPTQARAIDIGKTINLQVLEAASPGEFWAQVLDQSKLEQLSVLMADMNKHYNQLPAKTGFTPIGSKLYACKYSVDDQWYRAQVYDFDTLGADVIYLDYGNREKVPFTHLHSLESRHCTLPFQAIRCSLHNITGTGPSGSWTEQALTFFKTSVCAPITAKIMKKDDVFCEILIRLSDGAKLIEKMVAEGLALPLSAAYSALPKPARVTSVSRFMTKELPKLVIPEAEVETVVVLAKNPSDLVLQITSEPYQQVVMAVLAHMASFKHPGNSYMPVVGELVSALFPEDQAWYRADVKEIVSADKVIVDFIDFGNIETIATSSVCVIPVEMTKFALLGLHARLTGIELSDADWRRNLLENQGFIMRVIHEGRGTLEVDLFNKDTKLSISNQLVELGYAKRLPPAVAPVAVVVSIKDVEIPVHVPGKVLQKVFVTDATSPMDFTIQESSSCQEILPELEARLAALHIDYSGLYVPKVKELITVKYSDGMWYRAETIEVNSCKVKVQLIDYGNYHEADASEVNKIDPELLKFPAVGIRCALVGCTLGNVPWKPENLSPLTQMFELTVVDVLDGVHHVTLVDVQGRRVIEELSKEKKVTLKDQPNHSEPKDRPSHSEPKDRHSHNEPKEIINASQVSQVCRPQAADETDAKRHDTVAPSVAVTPANTSGRSMAQDLACQKFASMDGLAVTMHFVSPAEFYVIYVDEDSNIEMNLQIAKLKALYSNNSQNHEPIVGELVACFCRADGVFYRAEVLDMKEETITVNYIDFGNNETVNVDCVRRLDISLLYLPKQAIRCSMDKELFFTDKAQKHIQNSIVNKISGFILMGEDCGSQVVKDIYNIETSSSIVQELEQQNEITRGEPPKGDLDIHHLPNGNVNVMVVHVENPSNFILQVAEEWAANELIALMKPLNEYCMDHKEPYRPSKISEMICAKYENVWYRSRVLEILPGNRFKVIFIDYGNSSIVEMTDVRKILDSHLKMKRHAIPCCMDNVVGMDLNGHWSDAETQFFIQTFLEKKMMLKPTNQMQGNKHRVDFFMDDGIMAADFLVRKKMARWAGSVSIGTPDTKRDTPTPPLPQRLIERTVPMQNFELSDLPHLVVPDNLEVGITVVVDPSHFYCQDATTTGQQKMQEVTTNLVNRYQVIPASPQLSLHKDVLCAAFSKKFNAWYRAVVLAVLEPGQTYSIKYLDFGDVETVTYNDLRPLLAEFLKLPAQAIECSLADVAPPGILWFSPATELFKTLVMEKILIMTVKGTEGHRRRITLSCAGADVGSELVKRGLATFIDEKVEATVSDTMIAQPDTKPTAAEKNIACPRSDPAEENKQLREEISELKRQMAQLMQMVKK